MAKETVEQLRERAKTDLRVLFGVNGNEISEALIMFMVGLYNTGVDVVQLALNMSNTAEWERIHPSSSQGDGEFLEESEESKAQRRWEGRSK